VTYHPKLAILDFGSIRVFPAEIRRAYRRLARALLDRNTAVAGHALIELGFLDPGDDPVPMVRMLDVIFEPAYADRAYDPREYNSMERAMSAAAIKLENRVFNSPGHSVFLGRALVGLDSYMQQFGSVRNYHRLFDECIREAEERDGA
jgi:predicted unusual protein kinase regulating ubiquinone biosynthesis (AarF/ABC1/UbiB family)